MKKLVVCILLVSLLLLIPASAFSFIEWLKLNIFKRGSWGYYGENGEPLVEKSQKVVTKSKKVTTKKSPVKKTSPKVSKKASAKTSY